MPAYARRAHYGPVKPCPPLGTRVAYHGTYVAYHGIYPVVGKDVKGNAILQITRGRTIRLGDGNQTITCPGETNSPIYQSMIAAGAAVLARGAAAHLAFASPDS